jgi:serine/threonine-protein kinase
MKGKLSYMAPEQVTTKDVDRRVDIFALGCVLYETTLGVRPFHGEDALATLYQLLEQPILPPSAHLTSYPPGLEKIVVKALAKDPNDRYQTAEELAQALEGWLASTRTIVTESHVSEGLRSALGERIDARNQLIQETAAKIDAAQAASEAAVTVDAPLDSGAPTLESANTARSLDVQPAEGPSRSLRWALLGAAAAAVLGVGVVAASGARSKASQPVASAVDAPTTVASGPVPAERVVITIRTEPGDAVIQIDDGPPLPNPYQATVQPDARDRMLRARAAGYEDRSQAVKFDQTKEIVLVLPRATGATSDVKPGRPGGGVAAVRPSAGVTTATATPQLGELPALKKKKRQLDNDNPFAPKE